MPRFGPGRLLLSALLPIQGLLLRPGLPLRGPVGWRRSKVSDRWPRAIVGAILPWLFLFVLVRPLLAPGWPPFEWMGSIGRWAASAIGDFGLFLPFLLFAAGSALVRVLGLSWRLVRVAATVAVVLSSLAYSCYAVLAPIVVHRSQAEEIRGFEERHRFGPYTPVGLVRNLRFVQTNPPTDHSLGTDELRRRPPNVLLWELHRPITMAVFGIVNVLLGILATEATARMNRPAQWNARLGIGVAGAIAFYALMEMMSPVHSALRGDPIPSGILRAWTPLLLPVTEALLLGFLVWSRRR